MHCYYVGIKYHLGSPYHHRLFIFSIFSLNILRLYSVMAQIIYQVYSTIVQTDIYILK